MIDNSGKQLALVVDNSASDLAMMTMILENLDYEVMTALDGLAALKILHAFTPDVIFIDYVLPNISGDRLCRIVRRMVRIEKVNIIIISALVAEQKLDFREFGADGCIAKTRPEEMAKIIPKSIENAKKEGGFSSEILGVDNLFKREVTSELLSSKQHLESILENMLEAFVELSSDGVIIRCNAAAVSLFSKPEEELLALSFLDLFAGAERQRLSACIEKLAAAPHKIGEDSPVLIDDRLTSMNIIPLREEEPFCIVIIIHDITERKLAENELKLALSQLQESTDMLIHSEKLAALGEMSASVAHELAQPLNAIRIIGQSLQRDIDRDRFDLADLPEDLADISDQTIRMAGIIDHLRLYSRKSVGDSNQDMDVNEVVENALRLVNQQLKNHNVALTTKLASGLPKVHADQLGVEQVLLNLISNAKHALQHAGGEKMMIDIRTYQSDTEGVVIEVKDNGGGVPKLIRKKIFKPFFTTKPEGEGTGLGLSISRKILDASGGRLDLEVEEGKTSTFKIVLHEPGGLQD
jgi:PAS domain S-box-containing protein